MADTAEKIGAALLFICSENRDGEEKNINDENQVRDWSLSGNEAAEGLPDCGEGKGETCAAFVTTVCIDADKRAASGANFRAWLWFSAGHTEYAAEGFFQAVETQLPTIGKSQSILLTVVGHFQFRPIVPRSPKIKLPISFLRRGLRAPIILESSSALSSRQVAV